MKTIIRKVSVTEKGTLIGAKNQYMLEVAPEATAREEREHGELPPPHGGHAHPPHHPDQGVEARVRDVARR